MSAKLALLAEVFELIGIDQAMVVCAVQPGVEPSRDVALRTAVRAKFAARPDMGLMDEAQPASDRIELIDATVPGSPRDPSKAPEIVSSTNWSNLVLAVGALVLAGVIFSLLRSPDEPTQSAERATPVVTEPQAPLVVDTTPGVQGGEGPVLGRPTGLSLMVGGSNTPFRVLDLDTGDLVVSETILSPQFIAGAKLVYVSDTMTWSSIGLGDLSPGGRPDDSAGRTFAPLGSSALVVPADDATVWLTWSRTDGGRDWQLVDLESLDVLREVSTPVEARIPGGTDPFTGPEVVGSEAGGVFALQDDGSYLQVLDGSLIAVGADEVLVRQCSATLDCVAGWFARGTWTQTERVAPLADLASGRLLAGGTLMAAAVPQPALGAGLYDIDSGQVLRSLGPASLSAATVSPDGRWLVRRLLGRIEVVDVLGGQSTVVLNLSLGRGDSIIWIENASL